jgi:hypothetical protein
LWLKFQLNRSIFLFLSLKSVIVNFGFLNLFFDIWIWNPDPGSRPKLNADPSGSETLSCTVVLFSIFFFYDLLSGYLELMYEILLPDLEPELGGGSVYIIFFYYSQLADLGVKVAVWDINGEAAKETARFVRDRHLTAFSRNNRSRLSVRQGSLWTWRPVSVLWPRVGTRMEFHVRPAQ